MNKVIHFSLIATILTLPVASFANATPDLCAKWPACNCNDYNIYIENKSKKTWNITSFILKSGKSGLHDQSVKPGETAFLGAMASFTKGPEVIINLVDGNNSVTLQGRQNYCFFSGGDITAYSSNDLLVSHANDIIGSYKHDMPGASYFVIH